MDHRRPPLILLCALLLLQPSLQQDLLAVPGAVLRDGLETSMAFGNRTLSRITGALPSLPPLPDVLAAAMPRFPRPPRRLPRIPGPPLPPLPPPPPPAELRTKPKQAGR